MRPKRKCNDLQTKSLKKSRKNDDEALLFPVEIFQIILYNAIDNLQSLQSIVLTCKLFYSIVLKSTFWKERFPKLEFDGNILRDVSYAFGNYAKDVNAIVMLNKMEIKTLMRFLRSSKKITDTVFITIDCEDWMMNIDAIEQDKFCFFVFKSQCKVFGLKRIEFAVRIVDLLRAFQFQNDTTLVLKENSLSVLQSPGYGLLTEEKIYYQQDQSSLGDLLNVNMMYEVDPKALISIHEMLSSATPLLKLSYKKEELMIRTVAYSIPENPGRNLLIKIPLKVLQKKVSSKNSRYLTKYLHAIIGSIKEFLKNDQSMKMELANIEGVLFISISFEKKKIFYCVSDVNI